MYTDVEEIEEEEDPLPVRKETGPLLFLSLFLLLLAFFILLNTISTLRETKSRDVLSSVAATFQSEADPNEKAEILVSTLGPVLQPEQVVDEVERLWLTEVPFVKVQRVTNGRHIVVELPIIQLFVSGQPQVRGDRTDLLNATSYVLSARLPEQVVVMQAILYVEDLTDQPLVPVAPVALEEDQAFDPDDLDSLIGPATGLNGSDLAAVRVAELAKTLIGGGTPPDKLEIGMRTGDESRIRFRFYIRDEGNSHLSFTEVDSADAPLPEEAGLE